MLLAETFFEQDLCWIQQVKAFQELACRPKGGSQLEIISMFSVIYQVV